MEILIVHELGSALQHNIFQNRFWPKKVYQISGAYNSWII